VPRRSLQSKKPSLERSYLPNMVLIAMIAALATPVSPSQRTVSDLPPSARGRPGLSKRGNRSPHDE
jgi:hypothetical protein